MTSVRLPSTMRKLVVTRLTNSFRDAVHIRTCPLPEPTPEQILVRNRFVGVNASDINFTAGKYSPGASPPFDAGFEALGTVVAVGDRAPRSLLGKNVAHMTNGAFSEYQALSTERVFEVERMDAKYIPLLVSGMTAQLALRECAFLKPNDKVLVTAAAGGTGQFAVQLAKLSGCHVIGTCSTQEKADFLKSIGCDHPIVTSKENLNEVLKKSYPHGVDVVYESVGGETYEVCVNRMAVGGRLIVIGYISGYQEPMGVATSKSSRSAAALPVKLLMKSAGVRGFFLFHFANKWKEAFENLRELYESGKLKSSIDLGLKTREKGFKGIDSINDAVEFLYSRKSVGKIVVDLQQALDESKL